MLALIGIYDSQAHISFSMYYVMYQLTTLQAGSVSLSRQLPRAARQARTESQSATLK